MLETGPLRTRRVTNSGDFGTIGICRVALLVAGMWLVGCAGDLGSIDRKVDRLLAARSTGEGGLGGGAAAPERSWRDPELPKYRELAEKHPSSVNPASEQIGFKPSDENRDVAKRLRELQRQSAGNDTDTVRLDLWECWRQAQKTAREFLTAEEDYILAGIRLLLERHRWSVRLFADSSVSFDSTQVDGDTSSAINVVNQLGARKQLPFGGEVEARWVWQASEDLRSRVTGQYRQSSALVLEGNIPLLRGAGMLAEESLIQAERDLVYAARDFESFRREFLVSIARDYFAILQQRDNVLSTERQVESLRSIRDRQQSLFEAGRVAQFEVNTAASDVLNAEAGLANAEESLLLSLDRFRVRLGLPDTQRIRVEASELLVPEPDVSLDEAVTMALEYRLDYQNRRDRLDDTRRGVRIAMNNLLPDLNLTGSVSLPTDADEREGGAVYEFDDVRYAAGMRMDWPIDRETERLQLRQSIIGLEQARRQLDQFRDNLVIDVRARVREIERARFNLLLAQDGVNINLLRKEEQDINADQLDAQRQVDTANAIRSAEQSRDQAKADLRNAVLDYLLATGAMRVKRDGSFDPPPGLQSAPRPSAEPTPGAAPVPPFPGQ